MNELHLFAGAGGGILGGMLLGHTTVCAVEIEPYCRKILLQRQRDGILPRFPIWDDVRTFDGKPWRGRVDVVCGGFPCQDISSAGKGAGIGGARSGLWGEMARVIYEVGPGYVFVENSPLLTSRGLGRVLGDLAEMGYDAKWGVFSSGMLGADHSRERIFILANSSCERIKRWNVKSREISGAIQRRPRCEMSWEILDG
ncbi:DNA cytosine methyltransferase, partial [bacterium]|nr:DNA cytosine methyltransferase [bacterium]